MSNLDTAYGFIPPSGEFQQFWPANFNLPQGASGGISTAGWTADNAAENNFGNEGFIQQTFLGASIKDFDLSAGFGDSSSSMTINLVNDEYNKSDGIPLGFGDDPYHNGQYDEFLPPVVGTPVFFKFGKNPATIEQAFRQTYDDLYKIKTLPEKVANNAWGVEFQTTTWDSENFNKLEPYHLVDIVGKNIQDRSPLWDINTYWRGRAHFNFGGILQSYTQNKGLGGKPIYSVQLTDPREILSNVQVLLNNYQNTTFNYKNLINVYGFLEYDPSPQLLVDLASKKISAGIVDKFVDSAGNVQYKGVVANWNSSTGWELSSTLAEIDEDDKTWTPSNPNIDPVEIAGKTGVNLYDTYYFGNQLFESNSLPSYFPITGQGFSRRSDKGMPWYRISQALAALFQYYGFLPQEYVQAGFGGAINFRGYNYVVDFGGIPLERIPLLYYMDFDQIDLLSLAQELCEIISHELYVTLLPIIDHPASEFLYNYNKNKIDSGNQQDIIAGIIRLDAIDKTKQPKYGAIKEYLDNLKTRGIQVENQDVGYELSNVTTDKFIVGAQEVETYFFSTERDRDELWTANQVNNPSNMEWLQQFQWHLQTQEQQQVLPYYGKLGNNAVSIPRGFGAYQQILLDATTLNAYGVGNYYVATELELRAALVSYEKWKDFLLSYNDVYIEDTSEHRAFISALSQESDQINRIMNDFKERSGLNQLPDSPSKNIINQILNSLGARQYAVTVPRCVWHSDKPFVNENGYPASPCSPPFGYPLYYRRATSIGIVEAGAGTIVNAKTRLVKDTADLQQTFENINSPLLKLPKKTLFERMKSIRGEINKLVSQNKDNPNFKSTNERYKALIAQLSTTTQVLDNYDTMKANLEQAGESIAFVENLENGPLGKFLFNIEKTAKKHEENAKKVYDFVKSVADECLGKKFLVRIPKSCNVGYSPTISTFTKVDPFNIQNGPFGFPPRPIGDQTGVTNFSANSNPNNLWNHYLQDYKSPTSFSSKKDIGDTYTFGALKGNYNPFSENWEWNYKPEPQGGFYGFNVFGVNISALEALELGIPWSKMPPAIQQGLCPVDMTNLLSDSNRVQCYVRYNHSEVLDFTGVNPNDMVQQVMTKGGQFIPDIVEELPNNNIDNKIRFEAVSQTIEEQAKKERQPPSMAFVKCSVEENLFMPPRLRNYSLPIFGREYKLTLAIPEPKVTFSEVYSEETKECVKLPSVYYPDVLPVFSIPTDGGVDGSVASWTDFERLYDKETDSWIVDTNIKHLDDEHVYALITVPGRIRSIIDTRWNDGQNQAYQALQLKHLMTQDTVHIPEFNKPNLPVPEQSLIPCGPVPEFQNEEDAIRAARQYGLKGAHIIRGTDRWPGIKDDDRIWGPGKPEDWNRLSLEEITSARRIAKKVIQGSVANDPNIRLSYSQPSPVYPDIVALPLMSMERCYGPWLSTSQLNPEENPRVRYADIGGKVEFIKDENLAPWNYAGYQLMNEAGYLQAQFSNSLLLFSERGGFVVPDAPTGIALGTALQQEGPLITSIGINVSDGGVKTTVKLDLYTSKWGKLAKQKEMAISQIARERQKARDEKNSAIRRGLGKRSTSTDLVNTVMNAGGKQILDMVNGITNQIESNRDLGRKVSEGVIAVGKDGGVAYQDPNDLARAMSTGDINTIEEELSETAIESIGSLFQVVSNLPNQNLQSMSFNTTNAIMNIINPIFNSPE